MSHPRHRNDLPTIVLSLLFIAIMIVASFYVIQPFLLGFTWAGMVVIATWPLFIRLQKLFWGKRFIAVIAMTLLLLLLFVLPIALLGSSLIENSAPLVAMASDPHKLKIPDLAWLQSVPMIGDKLYAGWHTLVSQGSTVLVAKVQPYVGQTATWFVAQAAHLGRLLMHIALMVLFSVLLWARGEDVAMGIRHFAVRLGGERGDASVVLAGLSIRAVALGVVVTALVQSILGGIGLGIAGIPMATVLSVLMFVFCVAQLGPLLILIPAVAWLYWSGDTTWGTILLVWSCVVGFLDNFLRPALIRMGADLPMLLILSGVIGGLLAFGLIGLFIGPVVLAVSYRLLCAWVNEAPEPTADISEVKEELDKQP